MTGLDTLLTGLAAIPRHVGVLFGDPYAVGHVHPDGALLQIFHGSEATVAAVAQALSGNAPITGRMPITVPGQCRAGDGLSWYPPAKDLVRASSGFVMTYGIGASCGPFVASTLMSAVGPAGLFIYSAAINFGIGLFALYRMRMRKARPKDEQAPFVAVPTTTQVVKSLHPRAETETRTEARTETGPKA